jgi:hypothetical protein
VLFGGIDLSSTGFAFNDDTYEWNGSTWSLAVTTQRPSGRVDHGLTFDGTRVILFGGGVPSLSSIQIFNDTWAFDGNAWTQLAPTNAPSPRMGAAMAYDSARGRIVLFGGLDALQQYADTWEWDGVGWSQVAPATIPPARSHSEMVFDLARSRVVMFGGLDSTSFGTVLQDTWEYDGANWTQVTTSTQPPGRTQGAFDYDPVAGHVVLFGGFDGLFTQLSDAWAFDGTNWSSLPLGNAIDLSGCAHTLDLARLRIVYFGGNSSVVSGTSGPSHDYTLLRVPGAPTAAYSSFGTGCAGQQGQVSVLAAAELALPVLGTTFAATIDYPPIAAPFALVLMGFSNTSWAGGALPFSLSAIGIGGGCDLLVDPLGSALVGNGVDPAVFRLAIPLTPQLSGVVFHNQALVLDAAAPNGLGAMTNGCTATVQ